MFHLSLKEDDWQEEKYDIMKTTKTIIINNNKN
jgi:hypothetical protein